VEAARDPNILRRKTNVTDISIRVYAFLTSALASLRDREEGQDLIEYAMLGGLIAAAIIAVLFFFSDALESMVQGISNCIDFDSTSNCDPSFDPA
jgi:Flp pilus assembly pilin Flp